MSLYYYYDDDDYYYYHYYCHYHYHFHCHYYDDDNYCRYSYCCFLLLLQLLQMRKLVTKYPSTNAGTKVILEAVPARLKASICIGTKRRPTSQIGQTKQTSQSAAAAPQTLKLFTQNPSTLLSTLSFTHEPFLHALNPYALAQETLNPKKGTEAACHRSWGIGGTGRKPWNFVFVMVSLSLWVSTRFLSWSRAGAQGLWSGPRMFMT